MNIPENILTLVGQHENIAFILNIISKTPQDLFKIVTKNTEQKY